MRDVAAPDFTQRRVTVDALTAIWERVINRSPIFPDENFFDIGGDSLTAIALFLEIEKATGRRLPITAIYDAPTVSDLAAVLHQGIVPRFSPLVLLKPGGDAQPVFIAHGLGGSVMELSELARHFGSDHPIYGIQARGLDELDTPYDRIEDMAEYYLVAIKNLQPQGPYLLAGVSFGGLIQLEVAQRLSEQGQEIALLAFLDTWPHQRLWPRRSWVGILARRARHHAGLVARLRLRELVPHCAHIGQSLWDHIRVRRGAHRRRRSSVEANIPPSLQRLRDSAMVARAAYRPRFYPGTVTFFRAGIVGRFPDDPLAVWGNLVQRLDVYTIPTDHVGLLSIGAESVARQLARCLDGVRLGGDGRASR